MYVPSADILLRTKRFVTYRCDNGKPDPVGCLLLYFMLRHNSMINKTNIELACNAVVKNPKCGWMQAMTSITDFVPRIRFQKYPSVPTSGKGEEDVNVMETEKFGLICKSFLEILRTRDAESRKM